MSKRDFYDVLGVPRGASTEQIKQAYKAKARILHPDRATDNPDAEAQFKEVNEAYTTLNDPQKKQLYDQFGHEALNAGDGGQGFSAAASGFGQFSDVFESFFSDIMDRGQKTSRGGDLRYNIRISLEEAFSGVKRSIEIAAGSHCTDCSGRGTAGGTSPATCSACGGSGRVRQHRGLFLYETTCSACGGNGTKIVNPCQTCSGSGRVVKKQRIAVEVPRGIETKSRIRIPGRGEAGMRTGMHGDLFVFVTVEDHPVFHRDGRDLFCRVPVSMVTAALGGHVEIPTIEGGRSKVKIHAGSQSGTRMRLARKGMPALRSAGQRGNLYVDLLVETPVELTARQVELLQEFEQAGVQANNPRSRGFTDKLKGFWGHSHKT